MTETLKIALAQINPHLGALDKNLAKIREARAEAMRLGADLVVTPELSISGYPPEDLVLKPAFVSACMEMAQRLAKDTEDGGPGIVVGLPWFYQGKLYNAAFLLDEGKIIARRMKVELPNYGVFDEKRVFAEGVPSGPVMFRGVRIGLLICEDWWLPHVAETLAETGAELLLSINASPFEDGKQQQRLTIAVERVVETGLPFVFLAQTGGQDEVVYEGGSFVLNADRKLAVQMPFFEDALTVTTWTRGAAGMVCEAQKLSPEPERLAMIYQAMMMGLRDYVTKNGFPGVVIGLSGGIDSAISASVAADALGPQRVHAVMMPSPYTSADSLEDAAACARMLGISYETIPIEGAMDAFTTALTPAFRGKGADITEENIQSRSRGLILMALSNKFGSMLLTTGNKSEMAVGYATLYGDMCGGYSVLKDLYKTDVFDLSRWRNEQHPRGALTASGPAMPERVITKPPSAELRDNQTDQDSLPPYEVLDAILAQFIEHERSAEEVVTLGFDSKTVGDVMRLLDRAEYKRRQAPPGVKITSKAFGRDRRYPLTNGFTRYAETQLKKSVSERV